MKRVVAILAWIYFLAVFLVPLAQAINIAEAEITGGAVVVVGNQAAKLATITWEGTAVTTSNKGGAFHFSTTNLPIDCVGELSDGVNTIDVVISGCTTQQVVGGGVLKTGQTTGFVVGDDGDLELGTARSYTDNGTGLMWEKLTDDGLIHDKDNTYTWANAFAVKIAALNTPSCFAGHCDWRLPNVNELQSLADYGRFNPAIDPAFNSGGSFTQSSDYWSSTTFAFNSFFAWLVSFGNGVVFIDSKSNDFHVRAVRGGS